MIEGDVLLYLSGNQVQIKECGIFVTPPTIKQISIFGEQKFLGGLQMVVNTEKMFKEAREQTPELSQFDDLQVLLALIREQPQMQEAIEALFELLFPSYTIKYEQACIKFCDDDGNVKGMVTPFTLKDFQKVLDELLNPRMSQKTADYNPSGTVANSIAEKFRKAHEKKAKMTGKKATSSNSSIFATYISILSLGMNLPIASFLDYTPFQLFDAFERYWLKVRSDMYQRISTMPMMDTSKLEEPEDWTKSLYDDDKPPANVFTADDLVNIK